jgi:hypothetical protein
MSEILEEKKYTYQPTDDEGRPIGGVQVIKYTTHEELADKLREQNILLIRKLREETKKVRLGIVEDEEISADTQRFAGFTEFSPRTLTDEERYDLAQKLQDPTTAFEAVNTIIEAQVGTPLDGLGNKINTLESDNLSLRAKLEANAFVSDNPEYFKCKENFESITSWMIRYNLAPIKANYQKAYDTLLKQGVLILGPSPTPTPVVVEEPPVVEEAVEEPVEQVNDETPVVVEPVYSRIPTGLNNDNSSSTGPIISPGKDIVYEFIVGGQKRVLTGLQAVRAMPGDEYKRRLLQDKDFGKKVDKLEADARKKG